MRQCVHLLTHLTKETHRLGPLSLSAQWTMKRVIGVFSSLLRQPSNPFANLAAQAQKMAHINALIAIWPSFEKEPNDPHGSIDLGNSYLLLGLKEDSRPHYITATEEEVLHIFCTGCHDSEGVDWKSVYWWRRLKLPTEQVVRSWWKELEQYSDMARTDCNIKVYMWFDLKWD